MKIVLLFKVAGETGTITSIKIGENNKDDFVFLELMDVKTTNAQAMQPDWLEAIPGSAKLQEKFSRMKFDMVNLFIEAAGEGDFHLVRELINNYKVSVDAARSDGVTALHLSCQNGHLKLVQWLLEEKKPDIEKADNKGRRAIYFTIKGCQPELLNLLIRKGVEPDPLTIKKKYSPLLKAAAKQYTELAQILIKTNCCNVNLQDENGNTALHLAVIGKRKSELFDVLVQCDQADLTIRNEMGYNVFHSAVISGNMAVLEYLLDSKYITLALERVTSSEYSVFHLASVTGDLKVAKVLLDRLMREKLSVDDEDSMGNTALMIASARCQYGLIELFVKFGKANVNKMNYMDDTPISFIMKKIGIIQRIPLSEDSPDIYKIYAELCDKDRDTMDKYPSLAAVCYLIDNGGQFEMDESKVNDTKVWELLKSSVTKYQMEVEDAGDRRLVIVDEQCSICILCPNQASSNIIYKCCNQKSLTCTVCYSWLRYCPSCKKPMESFRRKYYRLDSNQFDDLMNDCDDDIHLNSFSTNNQPDLPLDRSKELVPIVAQQQNPEKIIGTNILPASSIIRPAAGPVHQVTKIQSTIPGRQFAYTYSSVRPSNMSVLNIKRTSLPNVLPITSPIIMAPTSASPHSTFQPVGASATSIQILPKII